MIILAKSIKESHNNERQEKTTCNITNYIKQTAENESNLKNDSQNDQQQKKNTFHEVDHLIDYFKTVGESCEDEELADNITEDQNSCIRIFTISL